MKILSGVTDQVVYFVARDANKARLTGLSGFTVYRSRNGSTPVVMTTPTTTEPDGTNTPGVYTLLLDEDMDIGSGNFSEEMLFHISNPAGGMVEVDRTIELYKPNQTRVNQLAGRAYRLAISSTADGEYKASGPVRLRPGAVDLAVSVDMQPQFGEDFVGTVGAPTVSAGSITAAALGPRDTEAMVQLAGTATASESRTVEFLVTMDNGDAVLVTFDVIVFAD